jgi:hypothetical protein
MSNLLNKNLSELFDIEYIEMDLQNPKIEPIQNYIVFDRTGIKHTEESKRKISDRQKVNMLGNTNGKSNKGKSWGNMSEEAKEKIRKSKCGKKRKPFSDEWKKKLSESRKKYLAKLNSSVDKA